MDYFKILPLEITLEILTRLPTESVLDSKLVCTNWRKIISNHPSFSKMHLNHLNHPSSESAGKMGFLVSTCKDHSLHYFEYDENHHQSTTPIRRITRIHFTSPFEYVVFWFVGSINGLVCLLQRTPSRIGVYYVCIYNPMTREYVRLPEIKRHGPHGDIQYENTSFGYVSSTNEYKIVRFYKFRYLSELEIHIYTLGSGQGWRYLRKFDYGSKNLYLIRMVYFANETLYWLDHELQMIGTFDLAGEKFCEHFSPPLLPPDTDWDRCRIGVLDGILSFVLEDIVNGFLDIWILKKKNHHQDKEEGKEHQSFSWSKEFRIDRMNLLAVTKKNYFIARMESMDLLTVTKRGGVLSTSSNHFINIYDTRTSTSKSLLRFNGYVFQVYPHKNTLVSLKELGEKDIKVMESAKIEEIESNEEDSLEDPDSEYIHL